MTAFNFHDRWLVDRRIMTLSSDDFRWFIIAGVWSVSNRTDGRYTDDDIALLGMTPEVAERLVAAGIWARSRTKAPGYTWPEFRGSQTSAEHLKAIEENRIKDAERHRRKRAEKRRLEIEAEEAADIAAAHGPVRLDIRPDIQTDVQTFVTTPTPTPSAVKATDRTPSATDDNAAAAAARQCQRCGSTSQLLSDGQGGWLCRKHRFESAPAARQPV